LADVDEIRKVYASNRSTKAINIWYDSVSKLGIYRQKKPQWDIPPQKKIPESPSSETTGRIEKIKEGAAKMIWTSSIFMQSLMEIRRGTAA